ncbi:GIY-YIG nuclease family protein [Salipaludibacillus sp. LMS25]|jgi:putative endonuclease|uniref:GIY-YIG nuclease family protein n=1 Tax=Salipaludibacillus sp. LMS25 TaxID=2924031 RepID=UPI0020D0F79F|nr:GIY-YIG nuclease family protein [Salipaludibacillus sp. LMS25]UTR16634.1 GIY-YIG nuclease family protein [Salipaludibacillus sp. LMS25]
MSNKYYVYVLKCKDDTYYTGYTTDICKRIRVHENGKGAKYTRGRGPFSLVYEQCLATKSDALKRERQIKAMKREEKERLIQNWREVTPDE